MDDANKPDEHLAQQVADGQQDAFPSLYERYFERLHDYARRLMRDDDEAADVVQSAFLKAYQALSHPDGEPPASFRPWLFSIAHHEAIDRLRRRRFARDEPEDALARLRDTSPEAEPERAAERQEEARWVWQAVRGLRPDEQELLLLNVREEMDAGEIASVLGKRRETVHVMLSRVRDSFEDSFTALVLLARGRSDCAALAAIGGELSPQLRRRVHGHVAGCATCQRSRRRYLTAAEVLGALAPVPVSVEVKGAVWAAVQEAAQIGGLAVPAPWRVGGGSAIPGVGASASENSRRWLAAGIAAVVLFLVGAVIGLSAGGGLVIGEAGLSFFPGPASPAPAGLTPARTAVAPAPSDSFGTESPAQEESDEAIRQPAEGAEEPAPTPQGLIVAPATPAAGSSSPTPPAISIQVPQPISPAGATLTPDRRVESASAPAALPSATLIETSDAVAIREPSASPRATATPEPLTGPTTVPVPSSPTEGPTAVVAATPPTATPEPAAGPRPTATATAPTSCVATPSASVSPQTVAPGMVVVFNASGFDPASAVVLNVTGPGSTITSTVQPDAACRVSARIGVNPGDAPGMYAVEAKGRRYGGVALTLQAAYGVVPGQPTATQPPPTQPATPPKPTTQP